MNDLPEEAAYLESYHLNLLYGRYMPNEQIAVTIVHFRTPTFCFQFPIGQFSQSLFVTLGS